nr:enoyl-CoA hydratase-related protein [Acidisphaera sp. L21]
MGERRRGRSLDRLLDRRACEEDVTSLPYSPPAPRELHVATSKRTEAALTSEIEITDRPGLRDIAINRPAKRNALTRAMYRALSDGLSGAAGVGARAIWLHGSAECFTAGNDLGDFAHAMPGAPSAAWGFLEALIACDTPIVATVNGAAVGVGTTMLLHCDLVCCSAGARFQLPFVNLGLCPEAASTLLLPARAGLLRASELLLLGDPFDAATAREAGIVNAILPDPPDADAWGLSRAEALAAKPPEALRATRALLRRNRAEVTAVMREEGAVFARLLHAPEARHALAARVEPRAASSPRLSEAGGR